MVKMDINLTDANPRNPSDRHKKTGHRPVFDMVAGGRFELPTFGL